MTQAWGVFDKATGKLKWWYDGESGERRQYEVFLTRAEAQTAKQEWLDSADDICIVRKIRIGGTER